MKFRILAGVLFLIFSINTNAIAADALSIMIKAHDARRVDDQISRLTFRFITPNKQEKQAIYLMLWKNMYGKEGYDNKAIFFTESPLDRNGIAYLGWLRGNDSDKMDDEWIYLPELRTTRRIVPRDHEHMHNDDEFGPSLLNRQSLEPRSPLLDNHQIIDEQLYLNQPHYLISSTPKMMHAMHHHHEDDNTFPARRIYWVSKLTQRINRIQFVNNDDRVQIDMKIEWTEQLGYWIWQRIEATSPDSETMSVLEISDIRINTQLKERLFSKRTLEQGGNRFK
jgi:hypothetical protein